LPRNSARRGHLEDVRADDHPGAQRPGHRLDVVQAAERRALRGEVEAHLLERLALCCCQEVRVVRLVAAARERHVARPGVAGAGGAPHQEHLRTAGLALLTQDHGHRRALLHLRAVQRQRLVLREALSDAGELQGHAGKVSPGAVVGKRPAQSAS
jgi:hypothetical protein